MKKYAGPRFAFFLLALLTVSGSFVFSIGFSNLLDGYPAVSGETLSDIEWLDGAATLAGPPPELNAASAILFEVSSGTVLYALNPDLPIPPASLTKLMTIHVLRTAAEERGIGLDDPIVYGSEAWAENAPPHSSLMFLGPGQLTSLRELLLGLGISSGNDAAVAAAQVASGSVGAFVGLMNAEARRLGMRDTYFEEPSGYSEFNRTTVRDFARFLLWYLGRWPDSLDLIHARTEFTYPEPDDLAPGSESPYLGITQPNRNGLIGTYEGADGFKTGYIDESGYNLAFTAQRAEFRLAGVILGVQAPTTREGSRLREEDARALLDYGFDEFSLRELTIPESAPIRVWNSAAVRVVVPPSVVVLPLPRAVGHIRVDRSVPEDVMGPIERGSVLAQQVFLTDDGTALASVPLRLHRDIGEAAGLRAVWDRFLLTFRGLFGYPDPYAPQP